MLEEPVFAVGSVEAFQPGLPVRDLGEEVEVIAHEAVGHDLDAGELGHAPDDAAESFFLDFVEPDLTAAGTGHDVVAVGLQWSFAEDAAPPTGPRTRGRIEACFGIHADELLFEREGLRIRRLGGFHDGTVIGKFEESIN
jgi:hypothetical protein